jgi:hypothetical protein
MRRCAIALGWFWLCVACPLVAASEGAPATDGGVAGAAEPEAANAAATAVESAIAATLDEGLAIESYEYRSSGRRDPFAPLIAAEAVQAQDDENRKPGINDIAIVGFVWGPRIHLALAETFWGTGLLLHEGDKLRDGRVLRITPDAVTVRQDGFGVSRQIKLTIGSGEEQRNER